MLDLQLDNAPLYLFLIHRCNHQTGLGQTIE
jgi:hypothetical protein